MIVALEQAVREQDAAWTTDREIAAVTSELTSALLLTTLKVNGAKNVGKPIHFDRPWEKAERKAAMLTMGAFAKQVNPHA
jgi:hypothetical protein